MEIHAFRTKYMDIHDNLFILFIFNFLHLFILHLHCTTIFDDDDAICEIK